jgi:hypothetical protein
MGGLFDAHLGHACENGNSWQQSQLSEPADFDDTAVDLGRPDHITA